MKPRAVLALAGAATLLVAAGVAVRITSTHKPSPFTAEYRQTALWDGGLLGTFTVGNTGDRAATGWSIEFELPRDSRLAGVWNGELFAYKSTYVIKPTAQTRTVGAHRSVRVGLSMVPGGPAGGRGGSAGAGAGVGPVVRSPIVPRNCTINGKACTIVTVKAALGPAPTSGPGVAAPDGSGRTATGSPGTGSTVSDGTTAPGSSGRGASPLAPVRPTTVPPTTFAPAVNLTNGDRPPLRDLAEVSGARALTLVSALPSAGDVCDLTWGGVVAPAAYAREIADALDAHVALIASIGAANGVDLAHACGSVAALETQVKKVLDLGLRSIDVTIASGSLAAGPANDAALARLAEAVVRLKVQYPGLTVSYSVPLVPGGPDLVTRPLLVARNSLVATGSVATGSGAVIDRLNVLPVDVAAPLDVLKATPSGADMVSSLLTTVTGIHDRVMKILGVDAGAAWRMLGVVPVVGVGDLVDPSSQLVGAVGRLADFARSTGLGLVGFLPLNTGQTCLGGLVGQLLALPAIPLLSCIDSAALPGFFTIVDGVDRVLR